MVSKNLNVAKKRQIEIVGLDRYMDDNPHYAKGLISMVKKHTLG